MTRLFTAFLAVLFAVPVWAADVDADGLHKVDWYQDTWKDLQEDFATAKEEGKRLLIIVEQRGCIYCREMHETSFKDEKVRARLTEDYYPIRINLHGATEMVDTDGEAMEERAAARKWGVMFTPTMIFMPPDLDEETSAIRQAVAVMPGAFKPGTTYDLLTWVLEERYLDQSEEDFQRYHARMIRERRAEQGD
ncbi:thioredoxin family protein [Shimia sp. FJ5]|uniref:thioredoxin family protein n=1 Tax=Shimia sp. FJ5 TaxID=3079054 RepID=UPI00262C0FE5|nr:thioredoxin family protein [Shimia sp. FJ5]MDV4143767.1 thioredoxin family protein [Shimia sp. FJ5]